MFAAGALCMIIDTYACGSLLVVEYFHAVSHILIFIGTYPVRIITLPKLKSLKTVLSKLREKIFTLCSEKKENSAFEPFQGSHSKVGMIRRGQET